jgi:hypothetical protein
LIAVRLLTAVFVVGCGSSPHTTDIAPTLRFADRSDAEINQLICSAASNDVLEASAMVAAFEMHGATCPGVEGTPGGGCTTASGTTITGSVTNHSPGIRFDALTLTNPTFVETWNGSVDFGNELSAASDLTVGRAGISVRADLGYTCVRLETDDGCNVCHDTCTPEGSGVELVGAGGALVSGTWGYVARSSPHLAGPNIELVGEDTLTVEATGAWHAGSRSGSYSCPEPRSQI